jgi:spermidine synthase
MWYFETLYPEVKLGLKGKLLYKKKTPFQDLRIYATSKFGNTLVLDGATQTTEKDEFIYHEMLTHPVMLLHPKPQKILIIGGGDGGILREVLKHKSVKQVYLVEIDRDVIETSKRYLKSICKNSFQDKRVKIVVSDGAKFVRTTSEKFDIVIVDSPDPVGVARVLFSEKFYKDINSILNKDGLTIRQTGSTFLQIDELKSNWRMLRKIFSYVWIHLVAIPTYIGGFFSITCASKKIDISKVGFKFLNRRFRKLKINTKYYNPSIHLASIATPEYIRRNLK